MSTMTPLALSASTFRRIGSCANECFDWFPFRGETTAYFAAYQACCSNHEFHSVDLLSHNASRNQPY